jgi:hypothetical protein
MVRRWAMKQHFVSIMQVFGLETSIFAGQLISDLNQAMTFDLKTY